jgi:hypothetical protein
MISSIGASCSSLRDAGCADDEEKDREGDKSVSPVTMKIIVIEKILFNLYSNYVAFLLCEQNVIN